MSKSELPAGHVDRNGYFWDSEFGDWDFEPVHRARSLTIGQRTTVENGYGPSDLRFSRVGNDLQINVPEQPHRLLLKGWYEGGNAWQLEHVKYSTGPTNEDVLFGTFPRVPLPDLVPADLLDMTQRAVSISPLEGEPSADTRPADATSQAPATRVDAEQKAIRGTAGNDEIRTGTSRHVKTGGGDDVIKVEHLAVMSGSPDNKELRGGHGNDMADYRGAFEDPLAGIEASLAKQSVKWGAGGSDRLVSIENIGGTDAADRLEGSKKDNILAGYRGDDRYTMRLGGGNDVIVDEDDTAGNVDTLVFGRGISLETLSAGINGDDIVIRIKAQGDRPDDSVTIKNGFRDEFKIEQFLLSDGTAFGVEQIGFDMFRGWTPV